MQHYSLSLTQTRTRQLVGQLTTHTHDDTQKKTRVRIWLYEDARMQIEGQIIGFDEYMNMVLDSAVEMDSKRNTRTEVGRILLKGDSITLLQYVCFQCFFFLLVGLRNVVTYIRTKPLHCSP